MHRRSTFFRDYERIKNQRHALHAARMKRRKVLAALFGMGVILLALAVRLTVH